MKKSKTVVNRNGSLVDEFVGIVIGLGSIAYPPTLTVLAGRLAANYIYFVDVKNKYKD